MSEKPILFSTPMVKAILEGRKTQTRRVIKPQPHDVPIGAYMDTYNKDYTKFTLWTIDNRMCLGCGGNIKDTAHWKPIYIPGDILWVRETWAKVDDHYVYLADDYPLQGCPMKPSIFMPKEAARIFLEVKSVRAERLQDITPYDSCCEGVLVKLPESMQREQAGLPPIIPEKWKTYDEEKLEKAIRNVAIREYIKRQLVMNSLVLRYWKLWDSLNAERGYSWKSNPWVWVIEFSRIGKEIIG